MKNTFEVGSIYYGTLPCAHSYFPVRVVKRTPKTVTLEHVEKSGHYETKVCRVRDTGTTLGEACRFHGWGVYSNGRDNSVDIRSI